MRFRLLPVVVLVLSLAACGGGTAPTAPQSTAGTGPGGEASTAPVATGAAIDLSDVDVCALVPAGTAERLTGETGFDADGSSSASGASCFWGTLNGGQYLEVQLFRRSAGLEGYAITPNGVACPGVAVPGFGVEVVGAACPDDTQPKVWLAAMDRGVVVQVLVNVPSAGVTPASLADIVQGVIAGLG